MKRITNTKHAKVDPALDPTLGALNRTAATNTSNGVRSLKMIIVREIHCRTREHGHNRHQEQEMWYGRQVFEDKWDAKRGETRKIQ